MLHVISKAQAAACVREHVATLVLKTETVGLHQALHRVLAFDLISSEDVPAFDRSTVDGYAVRAFDTFGARASSPAELEITEEIAMGTPPHRPLQPGECAKISTGGMLPEGADAVVMVEHTDATDGGCLVYAGVSPGENVTKRGDDLAAGTAALKKGTRLGAAEIGVLAALGVYEVTVFQKPVVALISTGDELVTGTPRSGQMRDVNSFLLSAALEKAGCDVQCAGILPDQKDSIAAALQNGLQTADLVLISGGSSAGERDMTAQILQESGEVCFHGVAMKPGKPTVFGLAQGKPVFGLPGHPLAAYFVLRLLVFEALRALLCLPEERPLRKAALAVNVPSNHGREEYLCVTTLENGEVTPLHTKSGMISILSRADGYFCIPRDAEGLPRGSEVEIFEV